MAACKAHVTVTHRTELIISSCIRGYHVYGEVWTVVLGEQLRCEREVGNVVDQYAISVKNDAGITVGYLPQKISQLRINISTKAHDINITQVAK